MNDYLQALYNGEITPDQYRQLTEGGATPAAPARIRSSYQTDIAKGAPRMTPGAVIAEERARRYGEQLRQTPTSPMPAAEAEAPAPASAAPRYMGPTTADLYPNGMPGDTPSMTQRFGNTSVGQAVGATGNFLGNAFDTVDNAKLAVDRAIGNTVGPAIEDFLSGMRKRARVSKVVKLRP
jgi:hypothetical protein